ncbi:VC2046/SO_2500 family protein [Thalassotalea euphylliae]|uniref:Uncharacterized protein n=1 Tax=Thalassotalea euphylliae TaxID=1655234 RepID=A0A3E0TYC7_9GAMM|nr:VC2046/SO_2500 family protein [Thalassotalea euphylliae]REL29407.1 hypothetical protein DXX94_00980 [Thalassotalea euphylliae]
MLVVPLAVLLAANPLIENIHLQHEHQLGESLNKCVHHERRADFSLMLAMLNDDVRQQSQFLMPKTEQSVAEITDARLRAELELPKPASLGITNSNQIAQYDQAALAEQDLMASIKLSDALNPKPISFRDNKHHLPTHVVGNTSIHCQTRSLSGSEDLAGINESTVSEPQESSPKRMQLDAKGWLKSIQHSLIKTEQPLITEQFA